MNIDVAQGTSRVIPEAKTINVTISPIQGASTDEIGTDEPDRRRTAVSQVMAAVLARLTEGNPTESH